MQKVGSCGVWSACPTPFDKNMRPDKGSLERMVEHHVQMGVKGLFVGGTCGEGLYMSRKDLNDAVECIAVKSAGRLKVAAQVTDVSAERILENTRSAKDAGADYAVISTPLSAGTPSEKEIRRTYFDALEKSPLPVGIYDRGKFGPYEVPLQILEETFAHPNVALVKDSSCIDERMEAAVRAKGQRSDLNVLTGYEFDCVKYLQAGYDGVLLGGGVFNAKIAYQIIGAVQKGDIENAVKLQNRMNDMMYAVYGPGIKYWLAGLKLLLKEMGIFEGTNLYLDYEENDECRALVKQAMVDYKDILWP